MTSADRPLRVFLVAAEPSGDTLGAGLAAALARRADGPVEFAGVGGPRMAAHGVESPFDISDLSIVGFANALMAWPLVRRRVAETVAHAEAHAPDVAVLIDSWGFTIRVAEALRAALPDLPIVKYVGPQVWAYRPGRAAALARSADHVLTLQPFEAPYYDRVGLAATFVGHPVLDRMPKGDGSGFRARYQIAPDQTLVAILLGSRRGEVRRLAPVFADAVERLGARYGDRIRFVTPVAGAVATETRALAFDHPALGQTLLIDEAERDDAFAAADLGIACSGTVVTELAMAGTPAVVAYKLGFITWAIARVLVSAPYISLVNMAAGEAVVPELVQFDATGENLAREAGAFIDDPSMRSAARAKLAAAVASMRGPGGDAAGRAAEAVLQVCRTRESGARG